MHQQSDKMEIHIKESALIRPAEETPKHNLQTTVLDRVMPILYSPFVYFYQQPKDSSDSFDVDLMKEALSKALVPFYPFAGRLVNSPENGEFYLLCNGDGVFFIDAETSCVVSDFAHSESSSMLRQLLPSVKYARTTPFRPLCMIQITRFKCGGVCVAGMIHHALADGTAVFLFINSWAEMTRGNPLSIPPVLDRAILDTGFPNHPVYRHNEYDQPPSMIDTPIATQNPETPISTAIIEISAEKFNILREKASEKDDGSKSSTKYSRFELLAAHIWCCVCKARALQPDQLTQVEILVDGRSRTNPKIPPGYVGNVVFSTTPIVSAGVIQVESLNDTVERIHESLDQMTGEYLNSALAHLKQLPDLEVARRAPHHCRCPNLAISNLSNMPVYDADFGWGRPVFFRIVNTVHDGEVFILPTSRTDGSLTVVVDLETNHLKLFKKFFNEIFLHSQDNVRSKY